MGEVTHNQDQVITLVNFKIKNTKNNNMIKYTPLFTLIILVFINSIFIYHFQYNHHDAYPNFQVKVQDDTHQQLTLDTILSIH